MNDFQHFLREDSLFTASAFSLNMKNPKPVTHSVRLESKVYEELSKEASKKSASFNNLVNQILKKYVEFDQFIPDLNFVLIHKGLIISNMEGQNDDTVLSRAEAAGGSFERHHPHDGPTPKQRIPPLLHRPSCLPVQELRRLPTVSARWKGGVLPEARPGR